MWVSKWMRPMMTYLLLPYTEPVTSVNTNWLNQTYEHHLWNATRCRNQYFVVKLIFGFVEIQLFCVHKKQRWHERPMESFRIDHTIYTRSAIMHGLAIFLLLFFFFFCKPQRQSYAIRERRAIKWIYPVFIFSPRMSSSSLTLSCSVSAQKWAITITHSHTQIQHTNNKSEWENLFWTWSCMVSCWPAVCASAVLLLMAGH